MIGVTRFRTFKKSGGRIYIPVSLLLRPDFPFLDDDLIKITIGDGKIVLTKAKWWEMLDWDKMKDVYEQLPQEIKSKIKEG